MEAIRSVLVEAVRQVVSVEAVRLVIMIIEQSSHKCYLKQSSVNVQYAAAPYQLLLVETVSLVDCAGRRG